MFLRSWFAQILILASATLSGLAATPNVILITLDTTRADRMGFLGSKRGLTPNLDAFAQQSVVFTHAFAHVPLTTPSHATILTGTYPQFNHLDDLGAALSKELPYLPDIFHRNGYQTAAFVGSQVLDPKGAAASGFDRGFDHYNAGFHSRQSGEDRYHSEERRATVVVNHAVAWLTQHPKGPFFVWVHLYDPHDPYDPPEPFKARYAAAPYDGEIAYVDFAVGKFLAALRTRSLYQGSVIAVMADHGEALGEHGELSHGFFLYDETIHVPLLIKFPRSRWAGRRLEASVGLVDVAPTLLAEAGIKVPSRMQGISVLNSLPEEVARTAGLSSGDASLQNRPIYAETDYPHRAFGWSALRALRSGKYLYVEAPKRELYDRLQDPGSLHNVAQSSKAVADTIAFRLKEFRRSTGNSALGRSEMTFDQAGQLEALGYVSSNLGVAESSIKNPDTEPTDPKDKIEIANLLHQALLAIEDNDYQEALPKLQQVVKEEPKMPLANLELGRVWSRLGKYDEGIPWLQKAAELAPESGRAHFELAMALIQNEQWAEAATQLEAAIARDSHSDELYFDLGSVYEQLDRVGEAEKAYKESVRLNAKNYRANLFLGRLLGMHGDPSDAVSYLKKAVAIQPQSSDAHKFLGNTYMELGRNGDADREQAEAARLKASEKPD